MKIRLLAVSLITASVVAGPVLAAGEVAAGQTKSAVCAACHGADGNSPNPIWPKLAGQHSSYLYKQIMDFKSGARQNELMAPMAAPLSDQDAADLAAYFSAQKQTPGTAAADMVAPGEAIFRGGNMATGVPACAGCHGPTGAGNPQAKFPRISGQHADYVAKALQDYRSGSRSNDVNAMMRGVTAHMTDSEIEAVAQYVQGLRP
jgi:cytochrome c553